MDEADRGEGTGRRPRVVILGGGVAGITTAFELSSPGWRDRFESITVYQYGWRLGGKGASGRGVHDRIEEHGLHIWLGFYENAFRMMRECYHELGRDSSSPIATVDEAFERASLFILQESRGNGWLPWFANFPETDQMPGARDDPTLPSLWDLTRRGLRLALTFVRSAESEPDHAPTIAGLSLTPVFDECSATTTVTGDATPGDRGLSLGPVPRSLLRRVESGVRELYMQLWYLVSDLKQTALAAALVFAEALPDDPAEHDPAHHELLRNLVDRAVAHLRQMHSHPDDLSDQARREWYLADILLASVRGVLHDGVLRHPDGLDSIDDHDFAQWLMLHGASAESASCSMVTTLLYDLPFAYRDGNPKTPRIGAGTAIRGALHTLFTYTGAVAWKMRAGMGDIMFAPMWEVLDRRGVNFEFFHRIEDVHLSDDGSRVTSIDVSRQVHLLDPERGYRPLIDVKGLPCWPSEPLVEQLSDTVTAAELESFWSTREPVQRYTLHDGEHFDAVVLAIPVGAHPYVCKELIERSDRWRQMVSRVETIYTQAFQVWMNESFDQLGCEWPQATSGGYLEPFDTYADMRQLIPRESFPDGSVASIAYFCNAMPTPRDLPSRDDHDLPRRADEQVKANAIGFLSEAILPLWPGAVHRYPTEFRWEVLVDDDERTGVQRFDAQFHRANVDPSERYVLSVPGTSKYRIAPGDSGFDNLVLAGDWTRCGLNNGCVEAAVTSGLLAAAAVGTTPPRQPIVGCRDQGGRHVW